MKMKVMPEILNSYMNIETIFGLLQVYEVVIIIGTMSYLKEFIQMIVKV
jgi:hypothetical protein